MSETSQSVSTGSEWEILETLLPTKPGTLRGRPQEYSKREIIGGILYLLRTGGAWRMMPNDLPHWKTCYHYFRLRAKPGHRERIHAGPRDMARLATGKKSPDRCDHR